MKRLSLMACIAVLCFTACKKTVTQLSTTAHPNLSGVGATNLPQAENLGNILKSSNVLWKLNPLNPNVDPLITYLPNSNSGYAALLIDQGILNGALPQTAIKFVSANLQTGTSTIIKVKSKATGQIVTASIGRVTQYTFGMNKKFYVGTEASAEGGGHLIEYDPNTQTAWDLGQPLKINGRALSIYTMNVGSDGALYGGSFGGNGDVITFRYDYNGNFYADQNSIDADAKYVSYLSGDSRFTYATVGQDVWKLYSIDRVTGVKKLLMQSTNPYERIEIATHADAPYAHLISTHYRLTGDAATSLGAFNRPSTDRKYFIPYELENPSTPEIVWKENEDKLYYKFPGVGENSIKITGLEEDVHATGALFAFNNTLFVNSSKTPELEMYTRDGGFKYLGNTTLTTHCIAASNTPGNTSIYLGGYPRGFMLEYKVNQPWTVNQETTTYTPPDITSAQSNPRKVAQFQDADASGVYGSMFLNGLLYTKDGYVAAGGNNDRLTESTNRELSFSSYKNNVTRNSHLPEFSNFEFTSMCLTYDSNKVYVAGINKYGGNGKIYTYSPSTNTITGSIDFPLGKTPGNIVLYDKNTIIGAYDDVIYMMDITTGTILWKKNLGSSCQTIYAVIVAPDHTVWVDYIYCNAFVSRVSKFFFNTDNKSAVTGAMTEVAEINDAEHDENTKPSSMVFMESSQAGRYDLYISGLKSLYRINNCSGK